MPFDYLTLLYDAATQSAGDTVHSSEAEQSGSYIAS